MVEAIDYIYQGGRLAEARTESAITVRRDYGAEERRKWFRYDDEGRLTLVM